MDIFKSEETTVVDFRLAAHKNRTTVMDQLGQDGGGSYIIRPTILDRQLHRLLSQKTKTMNDQKAEQLCSMFLSNTCFK